MRSCDRYREAISARFDGEDTNIPGTRIEAHLAVCDHCRAWAVAVGGLAEELGEHEVPALLAAALADLIDAAPGPSTRRGRPLGEWRLALAVIAVVQLVATWPGALDDEHAAAHAANELISWDLGLAVGFLALAWRPHRAWGALPVVAIMVAFLAGTSVTDLVAGRAELAREAIHMLQLAGLGCLWVLARRIPRASVVLRVRAAA
jgi:predicted anti-sigma-YlaC factor YlaD